MNEVMNRRRRTGRDATAAFTACLAAYLFAAVACDPGTVTVELPAYDLETDSYALRPVEITTLDDLGRLRGRATTLIGGADIVLDYRKGHMVWNHPGHSVAFSAFDSAGVLIPEDFDSLAMASAYYNIESSMLFFEELGLPVEEALVPMKTYYWADFEIVQPDGESMEMADNAFYLYINARERSFFVFPYDRFQWLPMSMNAGIMTHEYAHAVFDALVYDPRRGLALADSAANFLYGLNEGVADSMAVVLTGDPTFMSHTVPKGVFVIQCNTPAWKEIVRDASIELHYTPSHDTSARNIHPSDFCPYDIGSFVSSLMYALSISVDDAYGGQGDRPSRDARYSVARWIVSSMDALGGALSADFELWDFFSLLVSSISDPGDRESLCHLLEQRYAMYASEVKGC